MSLADRLIKRITRRPPDFTVGDPAAPYLRRWWVIPRNRVFNVYLHEFLRDDDDRALHDHPWPWLSIMLRGEYIEHTIAAGGINHAKRHQAGGFRAHGPNYAHRLALADHGRPAWTLFITGPRLREWGFHCPFAGWVHWQNFTSTDGRQVGKGCDQ
jgi:hypothetical protein